METEVEGVKKMFFCSSSLRKDQEDHLVSLLVYGFRKTWSKIMCEYQSQTSVLSQYLRVGIVGKGDGINLVSIFT